MRLHCEIGEEGLSKLLPKNSRRLLGEASGRMITDCLTRAITRWPKIVEVARDPQIGVSVSRYALPYRRVSCASPRLAQLQRHSGCRTWSAPGQVDGSLQADSWEHEMRGGARPELTGTGTKTLTRTPTNPSALL